MQSLKQQELEKKWKEILRTTELDVVENQDHFSERGLTLTITSEAKDNDYENPF